MREGDRAVGLRDKYAKKIEEQGFRPIDLNEDNVRAIFERCLAGDSTTEYIKSVLYYNREGLSDGLRSDRRTDKGTE